MFLFTLPIGDFEFQHPWFLLLLLLLPLMWYLKFRKKSIKSSTVAFPHVGSIDNLSSIKTRLIQFLPYMRYLGMAALIIALARPRLVLKEEEIKAEGIDIILVMDLSSSMLARDFNPDRLTVSKEMAKQFIDKRPYDRIGLVVFAGESFTQSPLTTDHRIVKEFLTSLESGMLEDGTAIGMGLASAANRLKTSESESKVVILLTDGVNNAGYIKPMTAAEIAKEIDVKVYTIGVGSMGEAISPISRRSDGRYVFGVSRVEIDEELLTEISKLTGGQYFRATNEAGLEQIYAEIDRLEKTEIEVSVFKRYSEEFRKFLLIGLLFIALEWLLTQTFLRTLP
ncbi:MAG: VWA domain-containing protein [Saprospiraceae bacterium]|nr:VWA domain-containing protein [Bacteroidia bacterium]NNE14639.1 VWA domain-containing protein [Saprospiraceae bacterium]NNL91859.1 VWA domain-containing protein [Saprospiraceae bacterium]